MNDKAPHSHAAKAEDKMENCCDGKSDSCCTDAHGHYCGWLVSPRFCKRMLAVWSYNALANSIFAIMIAIIFFSLGLGRWLPFFGGYGMHGYGLPPGAAGFPGEMHSQMWQNYGDDLPDDILNEKTDATLDDALPATTGTSSVAIPAADNRPAADSL